MKPTVLVLNPNSTSSMTLAVEAQLRLHLPAGSVVHTHTVADSPAVIDTPETFRAGAAAAAANLPQALALHPDTRDVLLACFGDPGLEQLRPLAGGRRVHGLADIAMAHAVREHGRYAILTCGPAWVAMLQQRALELGWAEGLVGVWALPVNGKALAADSAAWHAPLQLAADAADRRGARALILGGAAFAGLGPMVNSRWPVIDCIEAAASLLCRTAMD